MTFLIFASLLFSPILAKFNFSQFKTLDNIWDDKSTECPQNELNYFGTKNTSITGENCIIWREATQIMHANFVGFWLYFFPDEYTDHNYCRNVRLNTYRPYLKMKNASMHLWLFESDEWRHGPWCYVRQNSKFSLWSDYKLVDYDGEINSVGIMPSNITGIDFEPRRCFCMEATTTITTTATAPITPQNATTSTDSMSTNSMPEDISPDNVSSTTTLDF